MREIKFRAWDKENKQMVLGENTSVSTPSFEYGKFVVGYFPENDDYYELVLMQYTNLKDKNNKEIYIGDILKLNNDNYDPLDDILYVGIVEVITTKNLGFAFKMISPTIDNVVWDSSSFWHVGKKDTTEIIGNIYENLELLEKGKNV